MASTHLSEKIELFKALKFYLKLFGVLELQKFPISFIQRIVIFACMIGSALTSIGYCLFEAKSTNEMIESLHMAMGLTIAICLYSVLLWKRNKIIHLLDGIKETIQTRNTKILWLISIRKQKEIKSIL